MYRYTPAQPANQQPEMFYQPALLPTFTQFLIAALLKTAATEFGKAAAQGMLEELFAPQPRRGCQRRKRRLG